MALPEGLKLLFVWTVFEKMWVMGNKVVGRELTEPFAELLTLEARLAWTEQHRKTATARNVATGTDDEDGTYHRQRETIPPHTAQCAG